MSRAFVRESDVPQLPDLPAQASPLPPGTKNYMTAAGARRLHDELAQLIHVRRPPLVCAHLDNDTDAKRELQYVDRRIRYLQDSLRGAEIVEAESDSPETVRFGATVTVRESKGEETTYRIVGVDEADPEQNWISWLSPLGRALMNARVGEVVTFRAPRGPRQLEIRAIEIEG